MVFSSVLMVFGGVFVVSGDKNKPENLFIFSSYL